MRVDLAPGWKTELDRGPDWLFVRLYGPSGAEADATGMAETLHMLMQQELTRRIVLELDELLTLPEDLVDELVQLHNHLEGQGGMLRLCGVSEQNHQLLRDNFVEERLPLYTDREQAVMGYRPTKPR